ncbi:MAG TPA: hypothetical protein VGP68_17375 [Gemmataceae bacterium]|nr:hypothetical protein [Gemmataceae bacterium]
MAKTSTRTVVPGAMHDRNREVYDSRRRGESCLASQLLSSSFAPGLSPTLKV